MRSLFTIPTHDDRGREVPLWSLPRHGRAADSEVPEHVRARLASVLAFATRRINMRMMVALFAVMIVLMVVVVGAAAIPVQMFVPIQIVVMLGIGLWQQRAAQRQVSAATRTTLLAECHCASCGYDLMQIPVDPGDGCTVCPECRAAWRLDRERSIRLSPAAATKPEGASADIGEPGLPERRGAAAPGIKQSILWFLGMQRSYRWRGFIAGEDDRGTVVELASPRVGVRPAREWASVPLRTRHRLGRRLKRLGLRMRITVAVVVLPLCLFFCGFQLYMVLQGPRPTLLRALPALMYAMFTVMLVRFVALPYVRRPREIVELFLGEGLCPSCAGDLKGDRAKPRPESEADGCTVCRTCHAAWRLPAGGEGRVTAPTLPTSGQPPHHPQPH